MDTPNTAPRSKKLPMHPSLVRALYAALILGLLAALGFGGMTIYKRTRHSMLVKRAQEHLDKKEYTQAAMTARWALDVQPGNVEAMKLLVRVAEQAGARDAVQLQRTLAEQQPKDPESYMNWANSALQNGDLVNARMALDGMKAAGLESGAYFDARARLADAGGHPELIEPAMAEAVRREPGNALYRLRLASIRMGFQDPDVRKHAFVEIEELADLPDTRRAALRVMLHSAMVRRDGPAAVATAERLRAAPEARLEDQLAYLGIMRKAQRWEFWWALGQMQAWPAANPSETTEIMRWLVRNGLAQVVVDWAPRLPSEMRLKPPMAIAISESLTVVKDWEGLRPFVRVGAWGDLDFQRRALLAKVLRESGDEAGSRTQWNSAVSTAGDREDAYNTLLTLTRMWKWDGEQDALLWVMARGRVMAKPALDELLRRNLNAGRTQDLLAVFVRQLELDPSNAEAKNNVAYASLLVGGDKRRAETLAAEAYRGEMTNAGYAATYAFALYSAGKHEDGLKIMNTVPEAARNLPATALSHALLLAATGRRDEAQARLAIAEKGKLLPEERALITRTRAKLGSP